MKENSVINFIESVLKNMPSDWLRLTTHRLDIYNESLAKTEFLDHFEKLFQANNANPAVLSELPTAYDYIRLGHPLSSVLEWALAKIHGLKSENVITFSSNTTPVLAVLRKNLLEKKNTQIAYTGKLPENFDPEVIKQVYGYHFDLIQVDSQQNIPAFSGSTVFISHQDEINNIALTENIDFFIRVHSNYGSILLVKGEKNDSYISEIQHVRRRETIAMTPADCYSSLQLLIGKTPGQSTVDISASKEQVLKTINQITGTNSKALVASSGLSIQYAIMMGLVHDAIERHPGKDIKFIVPPNCYGGTNDQSRRVAACIDNVEILDLPVDRDNDMVDSVNMVLDKVAAENAIPYIIAEIPTNPRVEVPDLDKLKEALSKERKTPTGEKAIDPVFILDQTFCPNVQFLGEGEILSTIRAISYVSGSKFPSGGKCTAGYCVVNEKANDLLAKIEKHLILCDNEATDLQMAILAEQLPSMNQRIIDAYKNTREFVNFIEANLPGAKINFVSEELADRGFMPSVFSLDLPTKGANDEEREKYKRALNLKLINLMINEIPDESKYCVSYGQLKGCYWTIPATSTQGTTKEGDKDYIVRVALSHNMDMDRHKKVFMEFVEGI
ncbi:PLP-dependent aminotransferase family protein [Marinigracilibium pacificum]|uniref:Cystathionine beta-synthase n=1 Tax=Marinigracilibium pacificum TaxID=2729599 RepID=A0A848J8U6_9BACT|nr:PLP-dependent transferase [Marinigracilibium pacificum]NMM50854.1 cystathionine beta-synthase [Marinigracilibium pacificum]